MADEPEKTPIRNAYAQRFADDLEANRKEQADVTEQITGLQARLDQLRVDEDWLSQAQGSLPAVADLSVPAAGAQSAAEEEQPETPASAGVVADVSQTVPQLRQNQPVKAAQPKQAAEKTAVVKDKAPAKKTTAKKTTAKAPAKKAMAKERTGPPLRKLILAILLKTAGEPRLAREVTNQLAQDHPDRATSVQTVRNNLESLVKRNAVEKLHQQGSAMYIANATAGVEPAADTAAADEGEQAPESAAEKVPAEV